MTVQKLSKEKMTFAHVSVDELLIFWLAIMNQIGQWKLQSLVVLIWIAP